MDSTNLYKPPKRLVFIQNRFSHPQQASTLWSKRTLRTSKFPAPFALDKTDSTNLYKPAVCFAMSQNGLHEPLKASNSHSISQNGLYELLRYSTNLCKPPTCFAVVKTSSTNIPTRFAQVRQNGLYNPSTCFRTSTSIQHALFYSKRILPSSTTLQQALL